LYSSRALMSSRTSLVEGATSGAISKPCSNILVGQVKAVG
jgi:hypothetical protein